MLLRKLLSIYSACLRAFATRKRVAYPGKLVTRLSTWDARVMPRNMILRVAAGTVNKLNQKPNP
jgi:hypothetical protein